MYPYCVFIFFSMNIYKVIPINLVYYRSSIKLWLYGIKHIAIFIDIRKMEFYSL